jgi:hypothetical protein
MPSNNHTNICIDCQRACGGCSWTEVDLETNKIRFEPIPGWTATPVRLNLGGVVSGPRFTTTYHITACPLYAPDPPRKRRIADYLELTEEQSRWFVERHGGGHL